MAVLVVIIFGGGGGDNGSNANNNNGSNPDVIIDPLTPAPSRGVMTRSISAATVRTGPSLEYLEIGPLQANRDVEVVGRNTESNWFQIYFPAPLLGWVPGTALRVTPENLALIPVAGVTPIPRPTLPPTPTLPPEPTATESPTPTVSPTPGGGIDLKIEVLGGVCENNAPFVVSVTNAGAVATGNREVRISVTLAGQVVSTSNHLINLEPNAAVSLITNRTLMPPRTGARVELLGTPQEINTANNSVECVVQGPVPTPPAEQSPTRTPTRTRTPTP
jgi:hypothetical protein